MARNRWSDNLLIIVILVIALGVYGLFYLLGLPSLGTIFAVITIFVLCCLSCYLPARWKKKKLDKYIADNPPDTRSLENFKYCLRCGAEMDKELKICTNCGQPFEI